MRVKLANTGTYDHERFIGGLAKILKRKPDDIAADFIEAGAIFMAAVSMGKVAKLEEISQEWRRQEGVPQLIEAVRQAWVVGASRAQ